MSTKLGGQAVGQLVRKGIRQLQSPTRETVTRSLTVMRSCPAVYLNTVINMFTSHRLKSKGAFHVVKIRVVSFTIGTIHTCNIIDITIIVVMSEMHVRIMCRCITWNVVVSQLSLVEARATHVRAFNNGPSTRPKRV